MEKFTTNCQRDPFSGLTQGRIIEMDERFVVDTRRCTIHVLRPFGRTRRPRPGAALNRRARCKPLCLRSFRRFADAWEGCGFLRPSAFSPRTPRTWGALNCKRAPSLVALRIQRPGTPAPLRNHLPAHTVNTLAERGWSEKDNGELLDLTVLHADALDAHTSGMAAIQSRKSDTPDECTRLRPSSGIISAGLVVFMR